MIDTKKTVIPIKEAVDYGTVCDFINVYRERYPFIDTFEIGRSILGRSIFCIRLGKYDAPASALYIGAHHGSESITSGLLLRYINEFCEYKREGLSTCGYSVPFIFCERCVYVVPMLNPDGVEISVHGASPDSPLYDRLLSMNGHGDFTHWQANERGVDLNHNYNMGFPEYKQLEREKGIYAGPTKYSGHEPESEPETKALCDFIRVAEPDGVLSLHTQGELIYGKSKDCLPERSRGIIKRLEKITGYTFADATGTASYGGLTDWFIEKYEKPSFTLECGIGENPLPIGDLPAIYSRIREALFTFPMLI